MVDGTGELAAVSIPAAAMVLSYIYLGAADVAGVSYSTANRADASGPLWWIGFFDADLRRLCPAPVCPGHGAGGDDGQPHFLPRRQTHRFQGGNRRPGGRDGAGGARAAAGVHL